MVTQLTLGLDRSVFEPAMVVFFDTPGSFLENLLREAQIPVYVLGKRLGFDPHVLWRFERVLRRFRPDVVHTHLGAIHYALPSLALRRRVVKIHTLHSTAEREALLPIMNRLAFLLGFRPIAIADAVAASMRSVYGIRDPLIIPNGIPVSTYERPDVPRDLWRRREGVADSDFVFVSVGRLSEQKNHALLLRAFAAISTEVPRALLLIAGEGHLRDDLDRAAHSLGVAARVRLLGLRKDVPSLLKASDVFVLSSDVEGNPLCVMEAMAAGLPVVGTAVGGVPELIEDGYSGWLVKKGDADALACAMLGAARDPVLADRVGRAASSRARERFDVAVMTRAYEKVYLDGVRR